MLNITDLQRLFDVQRELIKHIKTIDTSIPSTIPVDITTKDGQRAIHDMGIKAVEEIHEALQLLKNWKPHRQTNIPDFDREKFVEEIADSFAFMMESLIFLGVSADEFANAYCKKVEIVHNRINTGY